MAIAIRVGDQLVLEGSTEAFGAVRSIRRGRFPSLTVWIENYGDIELVGECVRRVHDGKVEVAFDELPDELKELIRHAHDEEAERPSAL